MGRTFGLLYLSHEPLPQAEIQARLGISAGSASMTLAALGRWGVVHRVWVRGERREHYQAETDFWKMISGVLNERERREIGAAVEVVARAVAGARAAEAAAPRRLAAEAAFTAERLERLHEILRARRDAARHAARPAHDGRGALPRRPQGRGAGRRRPNGARRRRAGRAPARARAPTTRRGAQARR